MRNRSLIALSAVGFTSPLGASMLSASLSAHHGNLGGFYGGCHLDLFPCHLVSWHVSRTLGALCRKNRPPKKWLMAAFFFGTGLLGTAYAFPSEAFPSSISFMGALAALVLAQATSHPYQPW